MTGTSEKEKGRLTNQNLGLTLIIVATLSLSVEGIAAKLAYAGGVTVMTALVLRYALAALFFIPSLLLWKVPYNFAPKIPHLLAVGLIQAMTVLCLFYSFMYIPAGLTILLLYLYPTLVTFLSYIYLKEPLNVNKFIALGLTLAGSAIIVGLPAGELDPRGIYFALLAALLNAIFVVAGARLVAEVPVRVFNTVTTTAIAFFYLALGLASHQLSVNFAPTAWLWVLVLALVCSVLAITAFFHGIKIIGASRSAIISSVEPFATALLAYIILGELLTPWQVFGGALVLAGVMLQRK